MVVPRTFLISKKYCVEEKTQGPFLAYVLGHPSDPLSVERNRTTPTNVEDNQASQKKNTIYNKYNQENNSLYVIRKTNSKRDKKLAGWAFFDKSE